RYQRLSKSRQGSKRHPNISASLGEIRKRIWPKARVRREWNSGHRGPRRRRVALERILRGALDLHEGSSNLWVFYAIQIKCNGTHLAAHPRRFNKCSRLAKSHVCSKRILR